MPLKRSSNYPAIIAAVFIAILVVGGAVMFAAHLILSGDWSAIFSSLGFGPAFFGLTFLVLLCLAIFFTLSYLYGLILRERTWSAAQDVRFLAMAPDQPDRHLALQPGEILTLDRRQSVSYMVNWFVLLLAFALLFAGSGEVIVFALLPSFAHSTLNPLYSSLFYIAPPPPPPPSTLDWIVAAFPLAIGFLFIALIPSAINDQRYALIADDQGLTIRKRLRQRFIPWNDIALFIQLGKHRDRNVTENYLLWGREHQAAFSIVRLPDTSTQLWKQGTSILDKLARYRFEGGFDRYAADAQRLLATSAARGQAPLQTITHQPRAIVKLKQRFPGRFTVDDLTAAPLASQELQPQIQDAAPAETAISNITLKERLPIFPVLLESVVWFIVVGALVFACLGGLVWSTLADELSGPWLAVAAGFILAYTAFMSYNAARQRRRRRIPIVIANSAGLTRKTGQKDTTITIPWDEIRAWAIKPSPDHTQTRRTYLVSSERATLTWTERSEAELAGRGIQGNRRLAYQERAEQLHSLIAVRTGLPLREMASQP